MDTKFSVAVHILVLISESPRPMNSDQMAKSVGTNASYIRKILALLKKSGIVAGRGGASGYALTSSPDRLTLLNIYQAVMENSGVHLLDIHQNPNDRCVVGRHIRPVLAGMFENIEETFALALSQMTLAGCVEEIRNEMRRAGDPEFRASCDSLGSESGAK